MKARLTVVTLGVGDLDRSVRFYRDQDPAGHLWEVVWNPQALPAD